jgi:predicted amidohydrolase
MTTIGIAQWLAAVGAPDRNLRDALALVDELAARGCELIVLPELWPCGYDPATLAVDARDAAEPLDGPRGRALSAAARTHGIWLFAGTVPELDGDRLYNTAVVYAPDGTLRTSHRKTHLYFPLGEDAVFTAGDGPTVLEVDGIGTVGLSTCFDGDHPDFARALHDRGARVVVSPCAYEVGAESWWDLLYPANALANGQWWIMANQHGGELLGASRVIAPDGSIRAEAPRLRADADTATTTATTLVVDVDLQREIDRADREAGALWGRGR